MCVCECSPVFCPKHHSCNSRCTLWIFASTGCKSVRSGEYRHTYIQETSRQPPHADWLSHPRLHTFAKYSYWSLLVIKVSATHCKKSGEFLSFEHYESAKHKIIPFFLKTCCVCVCVNIELHAPSHQACLEDWSVCTQPSHLLFDPRSHSKTIMLDFSIITLVSSSSCRCFSLWVVRIR